MPRVCGLPLFNIVTDKSDGGRMMKRSGSEFRALDSNFGSVAPLTVCPCSDNLLLCRW